MVRSCQITQMSARSVSRQEGLFGRKGLEKPHTRVGCQGLGSGPSCVISKLLAHVAEITDPTWVNERTELEIGAKTGTPWAKSGPRCVGMANQKLSLMPGGWLCPIPLPTAPSVLTPSECVPFNEPPLTSYTVGTLGLVPQS